MDIAKADAAVESTMVLRSGGERLVTTDGRRAASRRVVDSIIIFGDEFVGEVVMIVLPIGWTKALPPEQQKAATKRAAEKSLLEIIAIIIFGLGWFIIFIQHSTQPFFCGNEVAEGGWVLLFFAWE